MLSGNRLTVYNLFKKHKSLTDYQIEKMSGLNPNSIRPARLSLEKNGIIKRTEHKAEVALYRSSHKDVKIGLYTVYDLVKIVDAKNFNSTKKKMSKSQILKNLRTVKKSIKRLDQVLSDLMNQLIS